MQIAVNASSLKPSRIETFIQLAKLHPEHAFLFFCDSESNITDLP